MVPSVEQDLSAEDHSLSTGDQYRSAEEQSVSAAKRVDRPEGCAPKEFNDLPHECQLQILEKVPDAATRHAICMVSPQWNAMALSSTVLCQKLCLPPIYGVAPARRGILLWSKRRKGLVQELNIRTVPRTDHLGPHAHIMRDFVAMKQADQHLDQILHDQAESITRLHVEDRADLYGEPGTAAVLFLPRLRLFSNLREFVADFAADFLERTHLNCLKGSPLLRRVSVSYHGRIMLKQDNFPTGLLELSHLERLDLNVARPGHPFCNLPADFSRLSTLTWLSLERYCDDIAATAFLHLTSLQYLSLVENPAAYDAEWAQQLPPSLARLELISRPYGRGFPDIYNVIDRTAPCITALTQLTYLCCTLQTGCRSEEWDVASSFAGLSNLRHLDLHKCGVGEVPKAVVGLPGLRWLCLDYNQLTKLPVGPYLHQLETLSVAGNGFTVLPVEALAIATALTCLMIQTNPLDWTADELKAVEHIAQVIGLPDGA